MMVEPLVIWDLKEDPAGNIVHIEAHGLTQDDVEDVLRNEDNQTTSSRTSGFPLTFGWTRTGLYIGVVWEPVCDDPRTVKPITAFEALPPKRDY